MTVGAGPHWEARPEPSLTDWVIEDFMPRPEKVGKVISSGTFSVSGPDDQVTEWCLQIYPEGRREDTKDHVARARARTWYFCKQASHPM